MLRKNFGLLLLLLCFNIVATGQVTFIIESLPKSTPEEDTIFITGSFNNWSVNDQDYILRKQLNGRLAITLPADTGTIEYKFCRGSWMKVETSKENQYIPNRQFTYGNNEIVFIKISNWQDSGGLSPTHYIVFYFFASAFFSLFLLFLLFRIPKPSFNRLTGFLILNLIIIVLLIGSFLSNESNLIWRSHLLLYSQCILFSWGPSLFLFIFTFLNRKISSNLYLHFIPVFILLVFNFLRILNIQVLDFMTYEINPGLLWGDAIITWFSIIYNAIYHIIILVYFKQDLKLNSKNSDTQLLVLIISIISTLALFFFVIDNIFILSEIKIRIITNHELVLITLTTIIYVETYFFWKYPDVLKEQQGTFTIENVEEIKKNLEDIMGKIKPYTNPDLNIADLSDMLETKPHILSKILNDHYHKNFRDYINEYRVSEFINLAKSGNYKNYTYLAIAYEVGFNSKSTFNLAFKKITKYSPREYFKKNITR